MTIEGGQSSAWSALSTVVGGKSALEPFTTKALLAGLDRGVNATLFECWRAWLDAHAALNFPLKSEAVTVCLPKMAPYRELAKAISIPMAKALLRAGPMMSNDEAVRLSHFRVLVLLLMRERQRLSVDELLLAVTRLRRAAHTWMETDQLGGSVRYWRVPEERLITWIDEALDSPHAFEKRVGVVALLTYCVTLDEVSWALERLMLPALTDAATVNTSLSMSLAWALTCFVQRAPERTLGALERSNVDAQTLRRFSRKVQESFKSDASQKALVKAWVATRLASSSSRGDDP